MNHKIKKKIEQTALTGSTFEKWLLTFINASSSLYQSQTNFRLKKIIQ